jgi:uncharacterized protein YcfJ
MILRMEKLHGKEEVDSPFARFADEPRHCRLQRRTSMTREKGTLLGGAAGAGAGALIGGAAGHPGAGAAIGGVGGAAAGYGIGNHMQNEQEQREYQGEY